MSKSFLILKTSSIGDIIQTFPVVQYLRSKMPDARIDWIVEEEYADLVSSHPLVDEVFTIGTRRWRSAIHKFSTWKEIEEFRSSLSTYDVLFDLQGNTKSALVASMISAKEKVGFGWNSLPEKMNFFFMRKKIEVEEGLPIQKRYLHLIQGYFKDTEPFDLQPCRLKLESDKRVEELSDLPRPRYMVAFGSKWPNKRLAEETLQAFLTIIDQEHHPYFLLIYSDEREKKVADDLHALFPKSSRVLGNLTLPLWQRMMFEVDLVIAMDSAALHLCGTTKTPSFSIFGPSLASIYKPLGEQHVHLQGSCPYRRVFKKRCPVLRTCPTGACIRDIEASALFKALSQSLCSDKV